MNDTEELHTYLVTYKLQDEEKMSELVVSVGTRIHARNEESALHLAKLITEFLYPKMRAHLCFQKQDGPQIALSISGIMENTGYITKFLLREDRGKSRFRRLLHRLHPRHGTAGETAFVEVSREEYFRAIQSEKHKESKNFWPVDLLVKQVSTQEGAVSA